MAEPKKKLSATRSGNRRSHLALTEPQSTICKQCSAVIKHHTVCVLCGYYKGKLVLARSAKSDTKQL